MKTVLILTLSIALLSLPVFSQDTKKTMDEAAAMATPKPLDNPLMLWMIGEWVGHSETPMGSSDDRQTIEWSLEKQFVTINYSMQMKDLNPKQVKAMASSMKMSEDATRAMMNQPYKGTGQFTINPMSGEFMGYWFDSMRGVYKGTGTLDGTTLTSHWEGPRGTSTRVMKKVDANTMVETFKETDLSGQVMEGKTTWARKSK